MIIKNGVNVLSVYKGDKECVSVYKGDSGIFVPVRLSSHSIELIETAFPSDSQTVISATNNYLKSISQTQGKPAAIEMLDIIETNDDSVVGICQFFHESELQSAVDAGLLTIKQLENGEVFVQIMHHHVKNGANQFANSTDARYRVNGTELFSILKYIGTWKLNNKYEFYTEQWNNETDANPVKIRWSQTSNPYTDGTCTGYTNISNSIRGLRYYNSNTLITDTNPWWGAVGCWTKYGKGIPGLNNTEVGGTLDLYIRVG